MNKKNQNNTTSKSNTILNGFIVAIIITLCVLGVFVVLNTATWLLTSNNNIFAPVVNILSTFVVILTTLAFFVTRMGKDIKTAKSMVLEKCGSPSVAQDPSEPKTQTYTSTRFRHVSALSGGMLFAAVFFGTLSVGMGAINQILTMIPETEPALRTQNLLWSTTVGFAVVWMILTWTLWKKQHLDKPS